MCEIGFEFEKNPNRFGYQNGAWLDANILVVLEEDTFGKAF